VNVRICNISLAINVNYKKYGLNKHSKLLFIPHQEFFGVGGTGV
jgi:hypothetical protein